MLTNMCRAFSYAWELNKITSIQMSFDLISFIITKTVAHFCESDNNSCLFINHFIYHFIKLTHKYYAVCVFVIKTKLIHNHHITELCEFDDFNACRPRRRITILLYMEFNYQNAIKKTNKLLHINRVN